MDSTDSLDWIWDEFDSADEFDFDDDDDDDDEDNDDDDDSDISSDDLSDDCSTLWFVNNKKRPYGNGDGDDYEDGDGETTIAIDEDEGDFESVDGFYADAMETAENLLSEVQLVWTDTLYRCKVNEKNVPDSYTKTSSIEKMVLLYASNFIEQFKMKYPKRKQLVLVHENECGVQKCICTTIKPSRLVYHDLNDFTSYSEFVAKYITYRNLKDPIFVPKKIVSPATTLEMQNANCFELATLLVSFLIGCGYNAFVVHGYATQSVCNNDQTKVKFDLPKDSLKDDDDDDNGDDNDDDDANDHGKDHAKDHHKDYEKDHEKDHDKDHDKNHNKDEEDKDGVGSESESKHHKNVDDYDVDPMFDLSDEYVMLLIKEEEIKTNVQTEAKETSEYSDDFDSPPDQLYGNRVHSWVMIMQSDTNDESIQTANSPLYFIEPSTSELIDISNENYIGIEAVWNNKNYWVNLQPLSGGCAQYDFTLMNTGFWEHFLPDESQSLRKITTQKLRHSNDNAISRHLVMPNSWVNVLEVPRDKYLMSYPNGKKIVWYMNALKEYYGEYIMPDGLVEKTTFYDGPDHTSKTLVREIYKHRLDKLISIEVDYTKERVETVEYFTIGREDCLKMNKFYGGGNSIETKRLAKFYYLRLDSMVELQIDANSFVIYFKDRSDLLFCRICLFNCRTEDDGHVLNTKRKPIQIIDKYLRDESKHKDRDIATAEFNLLSNSIYVKYQYGEGQITQSSRLFEKPFDTNDEQFDPDSVTENIVYPYDGQLKPHEKYIISQELMHAENEALREISVLENDIILMLEVRSSEQSDFKLKIDTLDWDRNYKIKKLLQIKKDKKLAMARREKAKQIDYVLEKDFADTAAEEPRTPFNVRQRILNNFKYDIKYEFIRTNNLFTKKEKQLQLMMKALDADNFKKLEHKNKTAMLCSLLKNELNVLLLKMKRYRETRVRRYNNLVSYLNCNPDYKTLPPLKCI